MALLFGIEPPSSSDDRDGKDKLVSSKLKNQTRALFQKLSQTGRKAKSGLYFLSQKIEMIRQFVKTFLAKITDNKLMPHLAISFLFFIVAFSNINDRVQAYNLEHEINNLDPNIELSVVSDVGQFTPAIDNSANMLEKAISTSSYASGFIYNAAPTDTQITARTEPLPDNSAGTVYYIVRNSDTLSGIGWKFGVKIATLAYVNDLSNNDFIKPGMRLKVPQRGYEVSASLITQKQAVATAATATAKAKDAAKKSAISRPAGSVRNAYPYGYCTYYVAMRRAVPANWGNGGQWLNSARNAGYPTGSKPVVGAIMVSRESFWGHVAYVESVNGNEFTIAEMNARGWGITSRRTMSAGESVIKGFIY